MTRKILLLISLLMLSLAVTGNSFVDMIWVEKAERKLHLIKESVVVRSFPISLGRQPIGSKQRVGDLRTPEGVYFIDGRNPNSKFYLSLHISYPSWKDWKEAFTQGYSPGHSIMIHGEPSDAGERRALRIAGNRDWTDGCIALSNRDMREVWGLVKDRIPILIDP